MPTHPGVPVDGNGGVQRLFLPREAYVSVELGERIGDVLLDHDTVTPRQIAQAVAQ